MFLRLDLVVDFDINRPYFVIFVSVAKLKMEKLITKNRNKYWLELEVLADVLSNVFLPFMVIVVKILSFEIIDVMVLVESLNHQELVKFLNIIWALSVSI